MWCSTGSAPHDEEVSVQLHRALFSCSGLPIQTSLGPLPRSGHKVVAWERSEGRASNRSGHGDRKSTRLNSSHTVISYAVFCLKKKKKKKVENREASEQ